MTRHWILASHPIGSGLITLLFATVANGQLAPEEELKTLLPTPGFEVQLFASEPLIVNPAAIDVDTQGRVWVAEIQLYRVRGKQPASEKIKVLEDTDGDGKADKVTVFADNVVAPMSICVAGDKVYVATSPDLWVFEDKNHDLKADGPPKKLLTGFGGFNGDHAAHSLVLGPDHKWWMAHGDSGFDVTGPDGSHIKYQRGAMLRGELDGTQLETVAVNFRNPYEICVNSFGESFCSDNDNDGNQSTRICWIMEGGDYGWFGGPPARVPPSTPFGEHWHFRGHIPGYVPGTLVTGFGSPTGICFYESDAFGPQYKNMPVHTDPGPRELRSYPHKNTGFGMNAKIQLILNNQGDDFFRPDDICTAPDGRLYFSDWYDGMLGGHAYNNPDQGRIFVLTPKGKSLKRLEKPGPYDNVTDAIEGLKSPNLATQFVARERLLAEGSASVQVLDPLLTDSEPNNRARALWVLDRIGGEAQNRVVAQLQSNDPAIRALAIRILRRHGQQHADAILALADDSSPEVRREILLVMPKLQGDKALAALVKIASTYDGTDRYQLEAINIAANDRKLDLYNRLQQEGRLSLQQLPLLQLLNPQAAGALLTAKLSDKAIDQKVAKVLLEMAGNSQSIDSGRVVLDLVANESFSAELRRLALERLASNLSGSWAALAGDEKLLATFQKLLNDKLLRPTVLSSVGTLHLQPLAKGVLEIIKAADLPLADREQAITVATQLRAEGTVETIRGLLNDPQDRIQQAALSAVIDLQDAPALREVLSTDKFSAETRRTTTDRLMETVGGAIVLFRLIDEQKLPDDLKTAVIAQASSHTDSNVRVLFEKFIPESMRAQKLGGAIRMEDILALAGNAARGEKIFTRSSSAQCKNCHKVRGVGGAIGPDLSMIGKKYERKSLLETIISPSKAIAPEYVAYLLESADGKVHMGFLVEKTEKQVILKEVQGTLVSVPMDEVEALMEQKQSLMPELVLRDVTAQDAADLLDYLTTLK